MSFIIALTNLRISLVIDKIVSIIKKNYYHFIRIVIIKLANQLLKYYIYKASF